ncbi:YodL domain-containing protein [Hungatella sp.]|uniref:YodL domain-containing protein n=1 Tax=Hungatella sp. TaxID=2613924 RepID=UPI002A8008C9|nr:YodL domain-containing protein [Hungatella sp.]
MPKIEQNGGVISYYGNPVGYTEKEKAIVDSNFQNNELTAWLQTHNLNPQWTDGVMEQLLAGERMGEAQTSAPLKNVRIWQLKPDTDVMMKFISLEELEKQFGLPDPENYRIAYDGQMGTNNLEAIYTRCNLDHPSGYNGHSLSMSDVVELYDENSSQFHYCNRFGFKEISFEPSEPTQGMEQSMSQSF